MMRRMLGQGRDDDGMTLFLHPESYLECVCTFYQYYFEEYVAELNR